MVYANKQTILENALQTNAAVLLFWVRGAQTLLLSFHDASGANEAAHFDICTICIRRRAIVPLDKVHKGPGTNVSGGRARVRPPFLEDLSVTFGSPKGQEKEQGIAPPWRRG